MNVTDVVRTAPFIELKDRLCRIYFTGSVSINAGKEEWHRHELVGLVVRVAEDYSYVRLIYRFGYSYTLLSDIPARFVSKAEPLSEGIHDRILTSSLKNGVFKKVEISLSKRVA